MKQYLKELTAACPSIIAQHISHMAAASKACCSVHAILGTVVAVQQTLICIRPNWCSASM